MDNLSTSIVFSKVLVDFFFLIEKIFFSIRTIKTIKSVSILITDLKVYDYLLELPSYFGSLLE